jgi:hypothetical protein
MTKQKYTIENEKLIGPGWLIDLKTTCVIGNRFILDASSGRCARWCTGAPGSRSCRITVLMFISWMLESRISKMRCLTRPCPPPLNPHCSPHRHTLFTPLSQFTSGLALPQIRSHNLRNSSFPILSMFASSQLRSAQLFCSSNLSFLPKNPFLRSALLKIAV